MIRAVARTLCLLVTLALVIGACGSNPLSPTPSPIPPTPTSTATPTPTATTTPSPIPSHASASPWPACISGWVRPVPSDLLGIYEAGLEILSSYMGLDDPLHVEDMRYFVGPDPDWILEPRFEMVEHWYIKATLSTDPTYRGRWLVEKRDEQRLGVSAVAPYDTLGYESPDWSGFVGDGIPRPIEGLPGLWGGIQYDFVTGEGDTGNPGLADELAECLAGT